MKQDGSWSFQLIEKRFGIHGNHSHQISTERHNYNQLMAIYDDVFLSSYVIPKAGVCSKQYVSIYSDGIYF